MAEEKDCLFCDRNNPEKHRIIGENSFFYARWDNFPITQGHAEIVPKSHIVSFFELSRVQLESMYSLIVEVSNMIKETLHPDGFNVGLNEGEAAGRTVHHLHVHIIPRYKGDVPNSRGGIRNIIPGKGDYLSDKSVLVQEKSDESKDLADQACQELRADFLLFVNKGEANNATWLI